MKVLAVGGGSGGHVMPVVAVARELKRRHKDLEFRFIVDKKFSKQATELFSKIGVPVEVISAGKLRRYSNVGLKRQIELIFEDYWKNIPDLFRLHRGYRQSLKIIREFCPDVLFVKGGYVSLPVGAAAKKLGVPIVIHDSDTHPGLTNRMLAKYAVKIGTGSPTKNYHEYPSKITKFVGIPVSSGINNDMVASDRAWIIRKIGFDPKMPVVLVTGGGGGAKIINKMVIADAKKLAKNGVQVLLLTGKIHYESVLSEIKSSKMLKIHGFINGLSNVIMASDLVVSRAGATTLAELAMAEKPTILIPSPYLAADHQTKNAEIYKKSGAAIVLDEREFENGENKNILSDAILSVIKNKTELHNMSKAISKYAKPNALRDMVDLIETAAKKSNKKGKK